MVAVLFIFFIFYFLKISLFYFIYFIFGCVGSSLLCTGFLWLGRVGATLSCSVRASHCSGFSLLQSTDGLQAHGLSSCGSQALECRLSSCGEWAQLLRGMWDLPGPGLEPVSPALAGRFLTTAPPRKPCIVSLDFYYLPTWFKSFPQLYVPIFCL